MDASDGTNKTSGNGHADPAPVSLPSAAAAPSGAPVGASTPEAQAGAPAEPLIVIDDDARDPVTGKIRPGKTLNKKGRPPGIPNINGELVRAIKKYRIGQKGYLELLLTKSLQDPEYAKLIVPKILANVDLPAGQGGVTIHNNPQASASSSSETNVDLVAKLLGDAAGREDVARFTERLAACGAFARDSGNVRN